jgi:hypothetical protein
MNGLALRDLLLGKKLAIFFDVGITKQRSIITTLPVQSISAIARRVLLLLGCADSNCSTSAIVRDGYRRPTF